MASFSPNPPSARAYGIKTGEALMMARKKCPHLQIFPPHYELYTRRSAEFMELLRRYAPEVEAYSIDEAFCDMTGTRSLYGDPVTFAHTLKDTIHKELGFTVNVGISNNRLLAKMASDFENPDRVHTLVSRRACRQILAASHRESVFRREILCQKASFRRHPDHR